MNFYLKQDIRPLFKYANLIADISGQFIFLEKPFVLENILMHFFNHPDIQQIKIFDTTTLTHFVSLSRGKDGDILAKENEAFNQLPYIAKSIYHSFQGRTSEMGELEIFYSKDLVIKNGQLIPALNGFKNLNKNDFLKLKASYALFEKKPTVHLNLSAEERHWINTHTVKVGVEQWNPVIFSNDGTDIDGIAGDVFKLIVEMTGLRTEIINDEWESLLTDFQDKKIDILPATYYKEKRALFGLYSTEYFKMKDYLFPE